MGHLLERVCLVVAWVYPYWSFPQGPKGLSFSKLCQAHLFWRSGRTGRAGNTGVAVMLYDPKRSNITRIERESGVKFEHIAAPQPSDIAKAMGKEAAEQIEGMSDSVIPPFKDAAEHLLKTSALSPADLLAKALAKAVGYTEIKSRSLLTSLENCVTLHLQSGRPVYSPSFVYNVLRRFLPEETAESIKGLTLTADGKGAVFDVSTEDVETFLEGSKKGSVVVASSEIHRGDESLDIKVEIILYVEIETVDHLEESIVSVLVPQCGDLRPRMGNLGLGRGTPGFRRSHLGHWVV
ncbi:unnamed protein product [Cuscuta campestris]|uniref:DEAD-box ATP-dependent RNA helicase 7 n=1 Tax=Cuscuta campestris TaxID=132261 RepID=A0A484MVZ0_9ASTE|nr:unnamed protein product [Cuscuta campestris]